MRRGMSRGWPDGLAPAVARHQASWGTAASATVGLLVICGVYVGAHALAGELGSGDLNGPALWIGGFAVFFLLTVRRHVLAAGRGWLSSREYVKTRWVRTDRLVRLSWSLCGTEPILTLVDDEGRKVGVSRSDLRECFALTAQVTADVRRSLAGGLEADERALAVLHLGDGTPLLSPWQRRRRQRKQRAR